MDSRRKVLQQIGLGTAVATVVVGTAAVGSSLPPAPGGAEASDAGRSSAPPSPQAGAGPWWLLAPLTRGSHVGAGWFVAHLGAVERGASVLTLQHRDGAVGRVHLCHRRGSPRGVAHTELLDLVLMDGGQGDKPTDESLGRVVMGLAAHIRSNELSSQGDLGELARMEPHDERLLAYGPESLT
ncbi:hypothetical protein L6R53_05495 [Myxococcota bacterium]|nr:hypothetical protein [Myxococcota bacterium]